MDLWAYSNIGDLDELAKKNGIDCPRLRGYRLMKDEEPIDIREFLVENEVEYDCADYLCRTSPFWDPNAGCSNFCHETDLIAKYYTDKQNKTIR